MNIHIKDTLTLDDDNEYVVVSKVVYENKNYYYLLDKNHITNVMFCYEDNGDLVELSDKAFTTKLLPLFLEEAQKEIDS